MTKQITITIHDIADGTARLRIEPWFIPGVHEMKTGDTLTLNIPAEPTCGHWRFIQTQAGEVCAKCGINASAIQQCGPAKAFGVPVSGGEVKS